MSILRCLLILAAVLAGCSKPAAPKNPAKSPTVASLMPAATSLIIEMNASDHLVGVSSFDHPSPQIQNLPKVGDYSNLDWERLNLLKPNLLILFMAPDRIPQELQRRAAEKNIQLANLRIERVSEIFAEITHLGELLNEKEKASALGAKIQSQLDQVRDNAANRAKPRVLIVHDAEMQGVVGQNTFLSDLLEIAGGINVATQPGWITLDREQILALRPDIILHLLPESTDASVANAQRAWSQMNLPTTTKVRILRPWFLLQPGPHIGQIAQEFQTALQN